MGNRDLANLVKYKDENLNCLLHFIKERIDYQSELEGFPFLVATTVASKITVTLNKENYPYLQLYRNSDTYKKGTQLREANLTLRYYLILADPSYVSAFMFWLSGVINRSFDQFNDANKFIKIISTDREFIYTAQNDILYSEANYYLEINFDISESGIANAH